MGKVLKQVSFHPNLTLASSSQKSNPCACSEPWVHFRENITKQKREPYTSDPSTGDQKKPEVIVAYNSTKAGIDTADQMSSMFRLSQNTTT
ncbi:hypothetical protein TNCV_1447391 [Trichonephila clavipes]|nr:hypothetical protein TNCV_1447391 [Trichonephila clavipes]